MGRDITIDRIEKQKLISELAAKGMTAPEIARQTGINCKSVYYYMNREKYKPKKKAVAIPLDYKNPDARPGWNADRRKCKTCRYRQPHNNSTDKNKGNCNYIEIAGHSRGCAVEDCDRYVKRGNHEEGEKMDRQVKEPSDVLSEFLNYIDRIRYDYKAAHDAVKKEEKRLQDLLHELEFAEGENAKRRAGTKLQQSRRNRRRQKDEMMRLELVVQFFDDPTPKSTINKMRQLLGKQRKQEEFLDGERHYNPRVRE